MYLQQSQKRIITKTILYRIIVFIITFLITYIFTHNSISALYLSLIVEFLQTLTYYFYENTWNTINWGLIK
jgi:uncharacterized membrane protein